MTNDKLLARAPFIQSALLTVAAAFFTLLGLLFLVTWDVTLLVQKWNRMAMLFLTNLLSRIREWRAWLRPPNETLTGHKRRAWARWAK